MKIKIINICVVVLFVFSACNIEKESTLQVHIGDINQISVDNIRDQDGCFFSVKMELINNTDTVVRFWTMTCSYDLFWFSNSPNLSLFNRGCDSNYPKIVQLDPGKSKVYNGILCYSDINKPICENIFKLAFILLYENEYSGVGEISPLLNDKSKIENHVIWSDAFRIDSCVKKIK